MTPASLTFRGEQFFMGDEILLECADGATFQGMLNSFDWDGGWLTLANTGHVPVPGFGSELGFPFDDIERMEHV